MNWLLDFSGACHLAILSPLVMLPTLCDLLLVFTVKTILLSLRSFT